MHEMIDKHGVRQDKISFKAINIRNRGTMEAHNGRRVRHLEGQWLRVFPGGVLSATNILFKVKQVIVDVLAQIDANGNGNKKDGKDMRNTYCLLLSTFSFELQLDLEFLFLSHLCHIVANS